MHGVSPLITSSGGVDAVAEAHESGGASGGSSEVGASSSVPAGGAELENERIGGGGGGGNRWPRQETLALLKIRSDMDATFRDASLKGPLWEQVSRKLAELGFQRSAKKCKEKFENVYKYHKRTKDGRASKSDGKAYRFFDQLAALENTSTTTYSPNQHFSPPPLPPPQRMVVPVPVNPAPSPMPSYVTTTAAATVPSPLSVVVVPPKMVTNSAHHHQFQPQPSPQPVQLQPPLSNSTSSSSSTSSDEELQRRRGRKRKWKGYLERLMRDVVQKQEELQKKFLDTLEKRERDRIAREEAWRLQEMARMNRDHDLLVQERSISAAKDAAVIAFLQKVTGQTSLQIPTAKQQPPPAAPPLMPENPPTEPPPPQPITTAAAVATPTPTPIPIPTRTLNRENIITNGGGGDDHTSGSSSRWPKAEVEALIKLRTNLEMKYQENGPKGPLWEDISKAMSNLGYSRSSKRCKEKWENINKYFKKVKEGSKKRPEDSKTCPYFHQLDAIYRERAKNHIAPTTSFKPDNPMTPIMARPEQQWPLPQHHHNIDIDSENHDEDEDDEDDDDEEDEVGAYEMIANKQPSAVVTNAVE